MQLGEPIAAQLLLNFPIQNSKFKIISPSENLLVLAKFISATNFLEGQVF